MNLDMERQILEDALLVGGLINTLLRQSERTRIACLCFAMLEAGAGRLTTVAVP